MSASELLIIGRTGQLALSLAERAAGRGITFQTVGRPEVDLLEPGPLGDAVARSGAATIVNVAAYTAVDQAEKEVQIAERVNAQAPGAIASAAHSRGARFVQISTDYVFDGAKVEPYDEDDATAPLGVYGRTKLAGEENVRAVLARHVILRTSWVYSPFGRNFVKTMLMLAETHPELRVVDDQIGTPTCALDLADAILMMVERWRDEPDMGLGATYHLAGGGTATSWAGFAHEIFCVSARLGGPRAEVAPIKTSQWPTPAQRPSNSALASDRFAAMFGYRAPDWRQSVAACVDRLLREATFHGAHNVPPSSLLQTGRGGKRC
jgi:dTDP-4-dehydrorhamnose reductase